MSAIGIYLRVSTRSQDTASQEPDLKRWAESQGATVTWYKDKFTGKSMDRPGFRRLLQDVHAGKVGTIVVWRLDRLGRTAKGLTALFDDLLSRKINLVSIRDGLDLSTPAGRMMANILASVSQYETEVRAERIYAGLEVAREKGVKLGRPKGTGKDIKVTSEQRHAIMRMKGEKVGPSAISRATGLSRQTVYRVLKANA
jgi:DNA invertase Pin-like site-specific DNA recombinase